MNAGPGGIIHANLLACHHQGDWLGVLLQGKSGVGKSDLSLRLLECGWRLVADDRTLLWSENGLLFGRSPRNLFGLMEMRGQGLYRGFKSLDFAQVTIVLTCFKSSEELERMPVPDCISLFGLKLPHVRFHCHEASAPARLKALVLNQVSQD